MRDNQGEGAWLEELEGSANVVKAASTAIERQFTTAPAGFVSLMGWMTAFVSDATMALVDDGEVLGSRHLDLGNSGLNRRSYWSRSQN